MTDNEIIKAFEYLVKNANNHIPITGKMLLEDVLDVLNRQKAEIERLKNSFDAQASLIEKKSLAYDRICVKHRNEINTAKSEAIKEFKKLVSRRLNCNTPRGAYLLNIMNEVKKEMVGDDNA